MKARTRKLMGELRAISGLRFNQASGGKYIARKGMAAMHRIRRKTYGSKPYRKIVGSGLERRIQTAWASGGGKDYARKLKYARKIAGLPPLV